MLEHRFAVVTAVATFVLLMVGGAVNPTGSSLACPEAWFVCHGSMLPDMVGGVLFEHGHRLVAMTVGLLQVILTGLLLKRRPTARWRWLALTALGLVCLQGALGALTVQYKLPVAVSTAHLLTGMMYFALVLYIAYATRPADAPAPHQVTRSARVWLTVAALAVYAQIGLGALMRHTGGALASVDLPLHHGSLWPAGAGLPLQLHMLHRIVGVVVGLIAVSAAVMVYRQLRDRPRLRMVAFLVPVLVLTQVTLGVVVIYTFRAVPIVVAHVGVAAALWASFVLLWLNTRAAATEPATSSVQQAVHA